MRRKQTQPYADIDSDSPHALPVPVRLVSDTSGEALPVPNLAAFSSQWTQHNPRWDPASPQALARLLAKISPRHSPAQSPRLLTDFEDELESSPPMEGSSDDSDTPSLPGSDVLGLISGPAGEVAADTVPEETRGDDEDGAIGVSGDEESLKQSLRGLYDLWKRSRSHSTDEKDRQSFMRIVEEIVAQQ